MTILDQLRRQWTAQTDQAKASGGSPGDHAAARFPSEPPSLARPTPQGRATAAQRGGASPWWARALEALECSAPWMFEPVPADQLHLYVPDHRRVDIPSHPPLRDTAESGVTEPPAIPRTSLASKVGIERPHHAPASRPVFVPSHDPAAGNDGGCPSPAEVTDSGDRARTVSEPGQRPVSKRWSQSASRTERTVAAAARTRSRHKLGAACDIHTLLSDDHPAAAGGRARGGARARPASPRCGELRRGQTLADRSQLDGAGVGGATRTSAADRDRQHATGR